MINRKSAMLLLVSSLAAMFLLNGCKANKQILDAIARIEARLDALEKIVLPPKDEAQDQKEAFIVPAGDSFVLGATSAKVDITVFSNFQCPYCKIADKALRELLKDDELKGKIRLVFKHFPFDRHVNARPASRVALAAGEQGSDKFWAMVEKIFAHQGDLADKKTEELKKKFDEWAKEIGVDVAKLNASLKANEKKYDEQINADIKLGADAAHLQGTPWILVGGWLLKGDINAATIKGMIKEHNL